MRLREPLLLTGALGLAVAVACVTSVWTSIDHAQAIQAIAITRTITIDPAVHKTFGPPSDAAPAITRRRPSVSTSWRWGARPWPRYRRSSRCTSVC
jgi:hypothetical protein